MSEAVKTTLYVASALVVALIAVVSKPRPIEFEMVSQVGKPLFSDFADPATAASLEIATFDEKLGQLTSFKVERDKFKRWSIPSHGGYPADATDHMRDVAISLIDLKVLGVASELPKEHALFGVVEPNKDELKIGDEGVGMLVAMQDAKGANVARLVVGKEVKGSPGQRFVRVPPQDLVYTVKIDTSKFSTKFEDWIEKDLLKLSAFDVEDVTIKDYSVTKSLEGLQLTFHYDERFEAKLAWNSTDSKWECKEFAKKDDKGERQVTAGVPEGQQINSEKLNALKNSLDSLEIVDVRKKPAGLTADLKAGEAFLNSNEAVNDLFARGFVPIRTPDGAEIRSANGEVHIGTKDAAKYVLRFGEIVGSESGADSAQNNVNRFLFVSAVVDRSKLSPPNLEPEPEILSKEERAKREADDVSLEAFRELKTGGPGGGEDETAKEAEQLAERTRITKENQRKLDDYNAKVKKAEDKVRELNNRFAEWYYVIPDSVYKTVRLSEADLFQPAGTKPVGDASSGQPPPGFGLPPGLNLPPE